MASELSNREWEQRASQLEAQLQQSQQDLVDARRTLETSERRRELERQLTQAEAIDLDAGTLLAEQAMAGMEQPDPRAAVADLRKRKPFLFRPAARSAAMSGRSGVGHGAGSGSTGGAIEAAYAHARSSGDRGALLQYLRAKRRG